MAYRTLEEIRLRKEQLRGAIEHESSQISSTWNALAVRRDSTPRGEYIAHLISYGVNIIDAFLAVRKLRRNYGSILALLGGKKRKSKK